MIEVAQHVQQFVPANIIDQMTASSAVAGGLKGIMAIEGLCP